MDIVDAWTSDSRYLVREGKTRIKDETKIASRKWRRNGNIITDSKHRVVYFTEVRLQT